MADLSSGNLPAATRSIHRDFLEKASPAWLINATPARRAQFKDAPAQLPDWYQRASPTQRHTLNQAFTASFAAQTALDKAVAPLQDIDSFAEPLLVNALQKQFKVQLDVHKTLVHLRKPIELGVLGTTIGSFEVLRLPLLQAALHNFEDWECITGAFHASSGFLTRNATGDSVEPLSTAMTVAQFTGLCRSLDIGAQYQRYLNDYLHPKDSATEQALKYKFSNARKADLTAAAELALLRKDIEPADYQMILSVVNGEKDPWMGKKQVWFRDLGLVKKRMSGCVAFVISEKYRYTDELILYIPHDPHHPLKRFTWAQMEAMFKQRFTARDTPDPGDGSPTTYQRFFSQFVAYGDLAAYFDAFTEDVPAPTFAAKVAPYVPLLSELSKGLNPFMIFTSVREFPPGPPPAKVPEPDPYLNPTALVRKGHGIWADNVDLWAYLFDQHRAKTLADARSHAVPTADVDARARSEKLAKLLNVGLLVLNTVSMFVPVLGEVMMGVMVGQLLYETLEGTIEWSEGDRRAAKAHLVDVAANLALLGVMAAGGKLLPKLVAAKPEPLIEDLDPVTLPSGQQRLRRTDLKGYESPVSLPADIRPNPQGEYLHAGKSYIRLSGEVYEKTFDTSLARWRIQHPTNPEAYQPLLSHNGAGAWRHTLDRPLTWERQTLMRRLGPAVDGLTDEQLVSIADISGTSDDALRKLHMDNAAPPPALADTLRIFKADQDVAQVIEQVSTGRAVDGRYLYTLPLVTEMPRWPVGRVLEVFDEPSLAGPSQRYGVERLYPGVKLKAPIRVSRADVLSSKLPAHILDALDETEVVSLLGAEPARVRESRPQEFRKQLAEYARTRQPALFDSLYTGTEKPAAMVAKLQRLFPGLSEHAAQSVLADADGEQLARLRKTGRVPLALQEQARWYVRQGRVGRAYAGLHMENMQSADSKHLALHTLSKLPGWPDGMRLESRAGSIDGTLLDSIGSESALQRKYLVKQGPVYQAFNERGEALNSLAPYGDNFYASILHALPDDARQSLGVPHVGQSQELRRMIIDYATEHPVESTQIVEGTPARQAWFNPPRRIAGKLLGYPLSGRGEGAVAALASRARALYPLMSEAQANEFVLAHLREGKNDHQVLTLLENRRREWETLDSTLRAWEAAAPADPFEMWLSGNDPRPRMATALRRSWQRGPLSESPGSADLVLNGDAALPVLGADFSHVRSLTMKGRGLIEGNIGQLLSQVPRLQSLTVVGGDAVLHSLIDGLEGLRDLTRLHIEPMTNISGGEQTRLEGLTQLQHLNLNSAYRLPRPLDVSRMSTLRSLKLSGGGERDFPVGVFGLPDLAQLELQGTNIEALPPQLFEPGRGRLWAGLSFKWSNLTQERFSAAFDFVKAQPEHVMDPHQMVRDYCIGRFKDHLGRPFQSSPSRSLDLASAFFVKWPDAQAQVDAMGGLAAEFSELTQRLEAWAGQAPDRLEQFARADTTAALRGTWYQGVCQRYGLDQPSLLTLPSLALTTLPELPAEGFAHLTTLRLQHARVPEEQLSRFIQGFSGLRTLDLSGSQVVALDVSHLQALEALSLPGSTLRSWPVGAEQLPHLQWLDLRASHITHLPDAVLAQDRLLLDTHLAGTPLTADTLAALATARQRIEQRLGLPEGSLRLFEQEPILDAFPPLESGSEVAQHLLPLLAPLPVEGGTSLAQQLQRLHPALGSEGAGQWLERLRSEGLDDSQVGERIQGWERSFDTLTRCLNGWLFRRMVNLERGHVVTSGVRRAAGEKIIASWRAGVCTVTEAADRELSFHGMTLGNLPELPATLEHVESLNLNGVQLSTEGSDGFLRAFPRLRTLVLSSNPLTAFPDAVEGMSELERLELSAIGLNNAERLYPMLNSLERLKWLDLSYCDLDSFRIEPGSRLQTLNLSNNELKHWPEGTLQSASLRTLDLSSNQLEDIPAGALEGLHDELISGVDMSDNFGLGLDDLNRLQAYAARVGLAEDAEVLGMSPANIQQQIDELEHPQSIDSSGEGGSDSEVDVSPVQSDEELEGAHTEQMYRDTWLENLPADAQAHNRALWEQLAAEPDNEAFFNLLSLLPQTKEFDASRASLTARVWRVMKAAGEDSQLRETLFALSSTHGTCTDGRILTFSGLEIKVLEFETLQGLDPSDLASKGPALLKLSRNLFRLEQVEQLAARHMRPHSDPAEVRLQYLIGLKHRLALQGVPERMRFAIPISGPVMEREAQAIEALEKTDVFYQNLISRDYWVDYLKGRYPDDFAALAQRSAEQREAVEEAHADFGEDYLSALQTLDHELQADETQTRLALSRRADAALNPTAGDPQQPGTSAGLPR
ncbi:NEL-type E3 ubiquitin ligase domain-containing protein [Pseudomonas sp. Marseille-Q1929]|uniref:NEL-type E3 ubiquitin ligase domain-containing protein n=1 Tax=Pseudomonas sp. Marseille-Q1929 TaxID=2730402 RepID=UPI001A8EE8A6|nr:NEL-type E3 ubiquitin ligase domain-containing protein [Pseudomonas sp. Marseille-Q1929]MBO0494794.1 hypothetical protein [Pseudomonas sp. Marseille-Q1929]